jgi:hypothetical protein
MNRKKTISFVLIAVIGFALVVIVLFQISNPKIAVNATGTYLELSDGPHINVKVTNPTERTLYDCFVNVNYLSANNSIGKFWLHIGTLEPFQESSRIVGVDDLNPNIANLKDGITCEGYGYWKPQSSDWNHVM